MKLFFFITAYMHTNASPNKQQQTDFLHKNKTIEAEIVTTLNNIESFGKWIHQTFFEDI